jgi:hypothetical protein
MGGLLLRYYLRYGVQALPDDGSLPPVTWAGAADLEKAVLVATPNAGSVEAFQELSQGRTFLSCSPTIFRPCSPPCLRCTSFCLARVIAWLSPPKIPKVQRSIFSMSMSGSGTVGGSPRERRIACCSSCYRKSPRRRSAERLRSTSSQGARSRPAISRRTRCPRHGTTEARTLSLRRRRRHDAGSARDRSRRRDSHALDRAGRRNGPAHQRGDARASRRLLAAWGAYADDWTGVTFVVGDHLAVTRNPTFTDNVLYRLLEAPRSSLARRNRRLSDASNPRWPHASDASSLSRCCFCSCCG